MLTAHYIQSIHHSDWIEFNAICIAVFVQFFNDDITQTIENLNKLFQNVEMKGWRYHLSAVVPFLACLKSISQFHNFNKKYYDESYQIYVLVTYLYSAAIPRSAMAL